jgi:hypothetical protein
VTYVKPILVREPDAGKPPVRFDERGVKTEHGRRILRHNRGNPETDLSRSLRHRVTPRLYLARPWNAVSYVNKSTYDKISHNDNFRIELNYWNDANGGYFSAAIQQR